jgi:FkbM family methyltransferase
MTRNILDLARVVRMHIRMVRREILFEPLNQGSRTSLFLNYARWHIFYKYRGKRWLIRFDNGMCSWVYPYPDHDAGEANIWNRNVDYYDTEFVRRLLNKGDFIVDAGCNIGNRTWPLCDLISGALMIDAGEKAIERTRENLRLNGLDESDYVLIEQAVGEEEGEVLFTDLGGASTLNRVVVEPEAGSTGRRVAMTTIDRELEKVGRQPTYIKIDVEGHDLAALKGASRALRSGSVKVVKFEHNQSDPLAPLLAFFDSLGWVVFALDERGKPSTDRAHIERNMNLFAAEEALFCRLNLGEG